MTETELTGFRELLSQPIDRDLAGQFLELLMEQYFAERGCLWVEEWHDFVYHGDEELKEKFPFSTQVVESAIETGRGFVSFDSKLDERITPTGSIAVNDIRSCLCAAAHNSEGKLLAVAYFDNKTSAGNFTEEDLVKLKQIMALYPGAAPKDS